MADTQPAPGIGDGSLSSAQEALLGLLDSEEKPETEEATAEEESSEAAEEESEELEASDEDDSLIQDESEDTDESEEDPQNLLYEVKVDGETWEITLDELLSG